MEYQITGRIKSVGPVEDVGSNGFQKRDVVIQTEEQYPQTIMIQFDGAHVNKPDQFVNGELATISFNVKGREWVNPQGETKVFNTIQGCKISHSAPAPAQTAPAAQAAPQTPAAAAEHNDDLNF